MKPRSMLGLVGMVVACSASHPPTRQPANTSPSPRPVASKPFLPPREDIASAHARQAEQAFAEERWDDAAAAAQRCLETAPQRADCRYRWGAALERLDQPGLALEQYFEALRLDPTEGRYYPEPAALCLQHKLYDDTAALVAAGLARIGPASDPAFALRTQQLFVARVRDDISTMTTALEQSYLFHRQQHPETGFSLANVYAILKPPRPEEAVFLYLDFLDRICRGPGAKSHKEDCETAQAMVQRLGSLHPDLGQGKPPSIAPSAAPDPPPQLPETPVPPDRPVRLGNAYTVWGASVLLRSPHHHTEIEGKRISVTGVIGKTNLNDAPLCALHRPGVADQVDCRAPIPSFWLCDSVDSPTTDCIPVVGWASNYAQIWGAIQQSRKPKPRPYTDNYWGKTIPQPIPQRGASLTVTGLYGFAFTGSSSGVLSDPIMGILTYESLEWLNPPPGNPILPGMRR